MWHLAHAVHPSSHLVSLVPEVRLWKFSVTQPLRNERNATKIYGSWTNQSLISDIQFICLNQECCSFCSFVIKLYCK